MGLCSRGDQNTFIEGALSEDNIPREAHFAAKWPFSSVYIYTQRNSQRLNETHFVVVISGSCVMASRLGSIGEEVLETTPSSFAMNYFAADLSGIRSSPSPHRREIGSPQTLSLSCVSVDATEVPRDKARLFRFVSRSWLTSCVLRLRFFPQRQFRFVTVASWGGAHLEDEEFRAAVM